MDKPDHDSNEIPSVRADPEGYTIPWDKKGYHLISLASNEELGIFPNRDDAIDFVFNKE